MVRGTELGRAILTRLSEAGGGAARPGGEEAKLAAAARAMLDHYGR